jgi:hypothetical protein
VLAGKESSMRKKMNSSKKNREKKKVGIFFEGYSIAMHRKRNGITEGRKKEAFL